MKKILALLLVSGFLFACNSGSNDEKTTATDTAAQDHKEHEKKAAGLVLNNGVKWKADSTTLLNVALLQKINTTAKKESLESYAQTSIELEKGLNKMVIECKMKGADHDALHLWLEPVIEKTKELKKVGSVENARIISGEIENQINLFPQYFEK